VYLDRLPAALVRELEFGRRITKAGQLTWEHIVELAIDAVASGTEDIVMEAPGASRNPRPSATRAPPPTRP
jgi:hypothetical protein